MKFLSLFSGIGAPEKALDNLKIPFDLVSYCEINKYASKSYAAIHGVDERMNLGDITKVDAKKLPKGIDAVVYGFPCQDFSIAGKQRGLVDENGKQTRSGLFFDALRIIEETQPRVAIAENVKNLTGKRFAEQFKIVLKSLEAAGYNNYWKVLNLKDFGIPQNRERVFIVSIRKDIDNGSFEFPAGFPLKLCMKDLLEERVDEKYYISMKMKERFSTDTASTNRIQMVGLLDMKGNDQVRRVYGVDGISPTLNTMQGGHRQPKILVHERIRKLTPKECFRLMGFSDEDFEKAEAVNSNAQLYKQAGNSIGVPVVEHIIASLLDCGALFEMERNVPYE